MYWLLDVGVIALLIAAVADGYRRGIIRMLLGVGAFLLRLIFTLVFMALIVFVAEMTGALDALTLAFVKAMGQSGILQMAGLSTEQVANIFAAAVFAVVGIIVAIVLLFFISRAMRRASLKSGKPFLVNRIIGVIVWIALYAALLLVVLGVIRAIANNNGLLELDEMLRACPITGWVYKINPLTSIIDRTGIPKIIVNVSGGKFR
ncbi:MAG: hypothetical protein J5762_03330 [Clostridia bacterium]|nr:hypothetical protein [Clostridia bacterium]